jgi:hypothetical protein
MGHLPYTSQWRTGLSDEKKTDLLYYYPTIFPPTFSPNFAESCIHEGDSPIFVGRKLGQSPACFAGLRGIIGRFIPHFPQIRYIDNREWADQRLPGLAALNDRPVVDRA